ncbi:MAG: phosphate starvation-inducible protein PhoH [Omnitrophica WOR_2 bacterium SM23_29]|nr:MAG: phosphate starvation-inducible protein PhoH [Omnitrophica WOR_2 bacterium SM23_29]
MERTFKLLGDEEARTLFGRHDENLKLIEREFDVKIIARGENLTVSGNENNVAGASRLFEQLLDIIRIGRPVRQHEILYAIKAIHQQAELDLHSIYLDKIEVMSKRQYVTPKTSGQKTYVDAIRQYDIVFGIGPAGTGKTYLAMAMAINSLKVGHTSRIILTRPAIEAGESLGYLPGDIYEKVLPYLRPLYDALYDMMDIDKIQRFLDRGVIEVAPLAYMRGRTLNDAFIILDEAQNATAEQMKMFLTRLGFDSKTVITGDVTQSDLPGGRAVGLLQAQEILKDIEGIKFIFFTGEDIVRHELVQDIIRAYEKLNEK